jgi:2,5-diketo-D-gluconate reductase A
MQRQRMQENFEIFDFEINDEEIEALTALDKGEKGRQGPDPDTFAYIPA